MSVSGQALQYAQRRIARKLLRAVPWLGSLVALGTLASSIRRKGPLAGTVDTMFDFIPFVSGVKNAAEIVRGRDFIPDKAGRPARLPRGLK
jgi:type III secretory pathway component EscU